MGIKVADCYLVELGFWKNYNSKEFKRYIYTPNDFVNKVLDTKYGNKGVFKTVYSYEHRDINNSRMLGDFYLDLDDENNFENVREDAIECIEILTQIFLINEDDISIFFSGNKGLHITVDKAILGVEPDDKLNIIYKYIMNLIRKQTRNKTIDVKIYDNKRLFRIVNSQHEKTGLFKIPLSNGELKTLPYKDIKALAKKKRLINDRVYSLNQNANKAYLMLRKKAIDEFNSLATEEYFSNVDKTIRDTPSCIAKLLEEGPIDGTKNNTLAVLTSFYKSQGLSYSSTVNKLLEWNSDAISQGEFYRTVRSIYNSSFRYGCRTLKTISICDFNSCPLMKGKKRG